MRLAIKPDSLFEAIALRANLAPEPIVETQIALVSARAIMAGAELGIFSSLDEKPLSAAQIASACRLDTRATEALLGALVSGRYLQYRAELYHLTAKSRKWLTSKKGWSLFHYMPHVRDVWRMLESIEQFMREHYPRADPVVHCRGLSLRPSIFEQVLNVTLHCPNRTMLQARATCTIEILGRNPF